MRFTGLVSHRVRRMSWPMLAVCPEVTSVVTLAWTTCAGWSAVTGRCWPSTWPRTSRSWWSPTMTRGSWPAGPGGAAPGSWIGRCGGGWPSRAGRALPAWWSPVSRPGTAGNRWQVVVEQASRLGLETVCVQPMLVRRASEAEDFTRDKSDDNHALLIARLVTQLHCYLPERPTVAWARLRHLGNRRVEQLACATAAQQRLRDLLGICWSVPGRRPWRWLGIRWTR
jgi:Transposase